MQLNTFSVSSLLVFFSNLAIAIFAFVRGENKKLNILWGYFCIMAAIWGLGGYKFSTTLSKETSFFWWQIAYIGVILVPLAYAHFVYSFLGVKQKYLLICFYGLAFVLLFINFFARELFLSDLRFAFNQFYWIDYWDRRKNISFITFYILFYWFLLAHAFWQLVKHYRKSFGLSRNQLRYFILGSIVGWTGAEFMFFPAFRIDIYPVANFLIAIYTIIMSYAFIRHKLLDINVVVHKGFIYSILIALITGIYFIFVFLIENLFKGVIGYQSLLVSIFYAFTIALLFNPLKNRIQRIADRIFLGKDPIQIAQENILLKQELEKSERMKAVAALASGMAHEIKNPLTALKTFAEYLPEKIKDPEFLAKFSTIVGTEVGRIDNLVHQLLEFAKPSPLKLEEVDIHQLLDDTLEFLSNDLIKHRIKVLKELQATSYRLQADKNRLRQAFLNLFLNAIDAMPTGGTLTISTTVHSRQSTDKSMDYGPSTMDAKYLEISISDTGIGINDKLLPHIFEPFHSTKEKGTGLGLSITYGIVKEHNGKIRVESKLNQGTSFVVELPLQ